MKPKILLVDDEPGVCEVDSYYLAKRGYNIITANTAKEAISKVVKDRPQLVLLDILMPEMDGLRCLEEIKKINKDLPVIMVTCVDEIETAKKALEIGAVDYITKPLGYKALETAISLYLFLKTTK
ncbi:MAG: response regulator [Candidatus Omnitrophota bacterium]